MEELSKYTYSPLLAIDTSHYTGANNATEWMLLHQAEVMKAGSMTNYYQGSTQKTDDKLNTWAIRYHMNDNGIMKPVDEENESVYLRSELSEAFLEFAPNQMIL